MINYAILFIYENMRTRKVILSEIWVTSSFRICARLFYGGISLTMRLYLLLMLMPIVASGLKLNDAKASK